MTPCRSIYSCVPTHVLPTSVPCPYPGVEADAFANSRGLASTAARVSADDHRPAGAAACLLVDGDPEGGEGARGTAAECQPGHEEVRYGQLPGGLEAAGVRFADVVVAVCVGVEVHLACGDDGSEAGGGSEDEGGELHDVGDVGWTVEVAEVI